MKLPEAIALMLEGKVMVDRCETPFRLGTPLDEDNGNDEPAFVAFSAFDRVLKMWMEDDYTPLWLGKDGWREATPEELKEIGMEPRA